MINVLPAIVAVAGGACTLVSLLIAISGLGFTFSERMRSREPELNEIRKDTLIGSLLFILAAALTAFVTRLMIGWVA